MSISVDRRAAVIGLGTAMGGGAAMVTEFAINPAGLAVPTNTERSGLLTPEQRLMLDILARGRKLYGEASFNRRGLIRSAEAQEAVPQTPKEAAERYGVPGTWSGSPDPSTGEYHWVMHPLGEGVMASELKRNPNGDHSFITPRGGLVDGYWAVRQAERVPEMPAHLWPNDIRAMATLVDGRRIEDPINMDPQLGVAKFPLFAGGVFEGGPLSNGPFVDVRRQDHRRELIAVEKRDNAGVAVITIGFASPCPSDRRPVLVRTPDVAAATWGGDGHSRGPNWVKTFDQIVDKGPVIAFQLLPRGGNGGVTRVRDAHGAIMQGVVILKGIGLVGIQADGTTTIMDGDSFTVWQDERQSFPTDRNVAFKELWDGQVETLQRVGLGTPVYRIGWGLDGICYIDP